jgi:hypothetical protein
MAQTIKNIKEALIEIRPHFMTLLNVDTIQRKIDGVTGELKYVPWITLWNFSITGTNQITEFAEMSFWPNTTGSYDTKQEALAAAWDFVNNDLVADKWIFTQIWNQWATE